MPETPVGASSEITVEAVQHLAGLARIALTDTEVASLTSDLGSILTNIAKVSEVAGADVPATSHPIPLNNVTRADVIADQLTREEALANAPEEFDGMFRVSSILGEEQ
ncbi:aspartyl-tRNA(Asn)/glutamyl-tRNA(Gln) amidotransferase subunit C [Leucobacter exalbidus]|uniref:Aspartyl/glutamyl-tRNA(Asn/Gln) amidotransferase subunit C n=1 Tax=Leucobacter exalbidus TaxID=662960 RepID=A0A940T4Y6_9MICO|nr:Asp-tRNA(Asn)/Glu-tRNA(Gln) amidotransferase subunit GatC [Leucobacter exalbidus]MBP1325441.1 aspartyl-tRNA(Asn)/glutamyl-tRNA(Gln) amidotransferase subunit C [Leucobacter exalbidus]